MFFLVGLRNLSEDIVDSRYLEHRNLSFYVVGLESTQVLLIDVGRTLPIEFILAV